MSAPLGRNPARLVAEPAEKKAVAHPKPTADVPRPESPPAAKSATMEKVAAPTKTAAPDKTASPAKATNPPLTAVPAEVPEAAPQRPLMVSIGVALWRMRLSLAAGLVSAGVHMAIIITLAMMVSPEWNNRTVILPDNIEASIMKPKLAETREFPKFLEEIKLNVPSSVKSVSPQNLAARGLGSAGSGGGAGGGFAVGFVVAGSNRGTEHVVSGGTGSGIDGAYGTHMLGEVGELSAEKATFFGVEATGRKFVFVVDTSGSMRHNQRYLRCRDELLRSVTSMQYGQQYFIVFFSDKLYPMPENKLVDRKSVV